MTPHSRFYHVRLKSDMKLIQFYDDIKDLETKVFADSDAVKLLKLYNAAESQNAPAVCLGPFPLSPAYRVCELTRQSLTVIWRQGQYGSRQ